MQPPKTHFSTFSKVQKQKKSETKIRKITHSAGDIEQHQKDLPEIALLININVIFKTMKLTYSSVSNRRPGWNNRPGYAGTQKTINDQDLINDQGNFI